MEAAVVEEEEQNPLLAVLQEESLASASCGVWKGGVSSVML